MTTPTLRERLDAVEKAIRYRDAPEALKHIAALREELGRADSETKAILKSVLFHFGPDGAHKVTSDALRERVAPSRPQEDGGADKPLNIVTKHNRLVGDPREHVEVPRPAPAPSPAAVVEALKPFAAAIEQFDGYSDTATLVWGHITIGDLRRARDLYRALTKEAAR